MSIAHNAPRPFLGSAALLSLVMLVLPSLLAGLSSCRRGPAIWTESSGTYQMTVSPKPARLRLIDEKGQILAQTLVGGIRFGKVARWSAAMNYDPYLMIDDAINGPHAPEDFEWIAVQEVTTRTKEKNGATYDLLLADGTKAALYVEPLTEGGFCMELIPADHTERDGQPSWIYTSLDFAAPPKEQYYGLGGVFGSLAHRGSIVAMQMELDDAENHCNEAHVRIPFLVSSAGWALLFDSMRPGYVDVAASDPDRIRAVFADTNLRFCMLADPNPLRLTSKYHELTGAPALPPIWSFAPIQWRNEVSGQDMVLADATDIRRVHLPTGAIWIDRPYQSGYNTMDFDPHKFEDAQDMVALLHEWGFKVAGWNTPYL